MKDGDPLLFDILEGRSCASFLLMDMLPSERRPKEVAFKMNVDDV